MHFGVIFWSHHLKFSVPILRNFTRRRSLNNGFIPAHWRTSIWPCSIYLWCDWLFIVLYHFFGWLSWFQRTHVWSGSWSFSSWRLILSLGTIFITRDICTNWSQFYFLLICLLKRFHLFSFCYGWIRKFYYFKWFLIFFYVCGDIYLFFNFYTSLLY